MAQLAAGGQLRPCRARVASRSTRVAPGSVGLALAVLACLALGPMCAQASFGSQVLLPRMHGGLEQVMEVPFSAIQFSQTEFSLGFQETTTAGLRRWFYHQVIALGVGDLSKISMVYIGLEDGRFLGYFSKSSYTERASTGNATDLAWEPYTLETVNSAVERGSVTGVANKTVRVSCPAGERGSQCTSQTNAAVNASEEDACRQTAGNTWYAPCTADCCDAHIRNYYSTSIADRGEPVNLTRWRTYDHKHRPWYKQSKYAGAKWSTPYEFATSQALGLTAMSAATGPTGDLVGVFAIDYEVGGLSAVINQSLPRVGTWGYAVERSNGKLVALSTGETLYDPTLSATIGFSESRLSAVNVSHPSIASSATILAALDWPTDFQHVSESKAPGFEFQTMRLANHGLDWLVVAGQDINCQSSQIWDSSTGLCQTCPAGTIRVRGECKICEVHSSPNGNLSACHCDAGYYSLPGDTQCYLCPSSLVCGGGGPVGSTWPLPPAGWWYDYELFASTSATDRVQTNFNHVFQCGSSYNCMGSTDGKRCNTEYELEQSGVGYSCCSPSTAQNSTLCGSCRPGFARVAGRCSKCEKTDAASVLAYLFVFCSLVVVVWFRSKTYRRTSAFTTLVFFLQNLALQLDDSVHAMRFFTSLVLVDLDPISADRCLMDIDFVGKWLIANVWLPLLLAALLGCMCVFDYMYVYPGRHQAENVLPPLVRLKKSLFELALILVFPSCLWSMKAIICRRVNGRSGPIDVLSEDSSIECYGPQHAVVYVGGILLLILYSIFAIAMLIAIGLRRFRQQHRMVVSRGRALDMLHATFVPPGVQADPAPEMEPSSDAEAELSGCAETRECLKRLVRQQDPQLRVKKEYNSKEQGKLRLQVGQRIFLRDGKSKQIWTGYAPDAPKLIGDFPRDHVDVLNADSVNWNSEMVSHDSLASSFYPIRVSCFWYPCFLFMTRFMMVVIFAAGNVNSLDGKISLSGTFFEPDTEDSGVLVFARIDWKAFATLLLTAHLVVQLKYTPFWHSDQNDFETVCTVCLLSTGLCFLGTDHDAVARFMFFTIMVFFAAAIAWSEKREASRRSSAQARKRLRNFRLKLQAGFILVSSHRRKHSENAGSAAIEPAPGPRTIGRQSSNKAAADQIKADRLFDIDDSKDTTGKQREEIEQLLEKDPHTDDFAENQIEILTEKLRNNEWPALRGLSNVGGGRRPQDCLELLEAMMYLREPLDTLVIDLSHQDPVILDVMHNLCVQETLQSIADSFPAEEERISLKVGRVSHGLIHHLSPRQEYEFCIRGPILQFAPDPSWLGTSRMMPLANLGSCSVALVQGRNNASTIRIMKADKPLCFLAATDTSKQKQAELKRWVEHLDQVCKDFQHREGKARHTINIGPLFERPLELCVYLADCSLRLVHLFPTEADELEDLAEQFEKHACDMVNQCESGAEAEAALRSAGTALLNGADVYIFALESGLKSLMSVKLVKQYTEDVWMRADVHLHRTGIDADLRKHNDLEGMALARTVKIEDKKFQKSVGTRVGPISMFPFILIQRVCTTVAECTLIVLVSPLAEVLFRSEKPALAQFCRKRLAMRALTWSYPLIKCYMALLLHLSLLGLLLSAASQLSPMAVQTEFVWAELGIYFYALGFFLAELYQLKNLLLERLRVQSLHEAYLLLLDDWDNTVLNLAVALKEYTRSANQQDLVIIGLFLASFILRNQELQSAVESGDEKDWSRYVFGVNILLLVYRFLDLCSFNRHLGPLWITLQSMIQDILLFSLLAAALIVAFSGCLQVIFWRDPDVFFYPSDTVEFVLMTFFGEYDTEALYSAEPIWGRIIMITLLVLGTIVQLNLLIAMLTSTYEDKKDHSAAEWRLVRARIVVEFSDAVRSIMELPLVNVIYFSSVPILRFLFPAVWSTRSEIKSSEDWLRSPPKLHTGLPYYYNDRRSLYLQNTVDVQGVLSVIIHTARNLREAADEFDGLNEVYCKVAIGSQNKETEVVQENRATNGERQVVWDEQVNLDITQRFRDPLQITLYDSDHIRDDLLGTIEMPLSKKMVNSLKDAPQRKWYRVRNSTVEGNGGPLQSTTHSASKHSELNSDCLREGEGLLSGSDDHDDERAGYAAILLTLSYTPVRGANTSLHAGEEEPEPEAEAEAEAEAEGNATELVAMGQDSSPHAELSSSVSDGWTELELCFMIRDYRHPFVTFYEKPRKVKVKSHATLRSIIKDMFDAQQKANDVDIAAEGWHRNNVVLAHVPRECLSDMRHFVGPFPAKVPSQSQRCTTMLGLDLDRSPNKRLRDYFSNGRRPAAVDRLLAESVFLLLRNDTDRREWAYLKKNPQQELHLRSQQQADTDRATKLVMSLGKEPIEMDLRVFSQQHKQLLQKLSELQRQVVQMGEPQEAVPPGKAAV